MSSYAQSIFIYGYDTEPFYSVMSGVYILFLVAI